MGQDPSAIREEIEETRERMGERVDALAYKADVPSRTREKVSAKKDELMGKVTGRTPDARQMAGQVQGGASKARGIAEENPLGMAIGAAALGFLAGLLIPSTKVEDEKIGPIADEVKQRGREIGPEVLERGQKVAKEAAGAATSTAKDEASQQASELRDSAGQHASEAADQVKGR